MQLYEKLLQHFSHLSYSAYLIGVSLMSSTDITRRMQNFGRFLSNMIMPNIGAFIAWGIITALFIPTGWLPNATLAQLANPMITYLIPLMIGYSGGKMVGNERGGLIGAISTIGIIIGSDIPMLLGSMISGPLSGLVIKYFDKAIERKIKSGFEMLLNNFSVGIIGALLAVLVFLIIDPLVNIFSSWLKHAVYLMLAYNMLPLTSIFIEPAKILFLNNAINHGILSPVGILQISETGKSMLFFIEANPGPGMGILISYMMFGYGKIRHSASAAAGIHFFGGIHEIYFPYILMKPILLIAVIFGGMTGILTLNFLGGHLISPASPGSILAILAMTPKGCYFANIASIIAASFVSFIISSIFLKTSKKRIKDLPKESILRSQVIKSHTENKIDTTINKYYGDLRSVRKIIVACDAGMGSSAIGSGILRKKLKENNVNSINVTNSAINNIPDNVDLVITHKDLTKRAMLYAPNAQHVSINNFLDHEFYSDLTYRLKSIKTSSKYQKQVIQTQNNNYKENTYLTNSNVFLSQEAKNKEQAIRFAGEQLVKGGYVKEEYIEAMLDREKISSTYLGESIALPHGTIEAKNRILKTGVIFCQYPKGVRFGDEEDDIAYLVISIAARNNEHLNIITKLTNALDDNAIIKRLINTTNIQEVLYFLTNH